MHNQHNKNEQHKTIHILTQHTATYEVAGVPGPGPRGPHRAEQAPGDHRSMVCIYIYIYTYIHIYYIYIGGVY